MKTRTTIVLCASILMVTVGGIMLTRQRPATIAVAPPTVTPYPDLVAGLQAPDPENRRHPLILNDLADAALTDPDAAATLANTIRENGRNASLAAVVCLSRRLYVKYPNIHAALTERRVVLLNDPNLAGYIAEFDATPAP
jgi:hypothetical protein